MGVNMPSKQTPRQRGRGRCEKRADATPLPLIPSPRRGEGRAKRRVQRSEGCSEAKGVEPNALRAVCMIWSGREGERRDRSRERPHREVRAGVGRGCCRDAKDGEDNVEKKQVGRGERASGGIGAASARTGKCGQGLEEAVVATPRMAKITLKKNRLVGARGFEPPTTSTPRRCATRLRYAPMLNKPEKGLMLSP